MALFIYLSPKGLIYREKKSPLYFEDIRLLEVNGYGWLLLAIYYWYDKRLISHASYRKLCEEYYRLAHIKRTRKRKLVKILEDIRDIL